MIHLSEEPEAPVSRPVAMPPTYTSVVAPATVEAMREREYSPALREAVARARSVLHIRDLRPGQA